MEVLIGLGLALLVVTLIGHGVWVFVAFIINSLSVPTPVKLPVAPVAPSRRKCAGCGAMFAATFKNCPVCGEPAMPAATLSPQARLNGLQQAAGHQIKLRSR